MNTQQLKLIHIQETFELDVAKNKPNHLWINAEYQIEKDTDNLLSLFKLNSKNINEVLF